jgi:hypothetical protein
VRGWAGWAESGEKRGSRLALLRFCFSFSKCEIVLVFVYFNGIFVKLQKY